MWLDAVIIREELKKLSDKLKELEKKLDDLELRMDLLDKVSGDLCHGVTLLTAQLTHHGIEPNWKPTGMVSMFLRQFQEMVYSKDSDHD